MEFNAEAMLQLEHPLLKVPCEQLNKTFRQSQKLLEKEILNLTNAISEQLEKVDAGQLDPADAIKFIETSTHRIQLLKKKFSELQKEESSHLDRFESRLNHLEDLGKVSSSQTEATQRWNNTRLDRVLIDYLLREGFYETAAQVASESRIQDLVDIELFVSARKVEESLRNGSCAESLAWCSENKSKLKKLESNFEFNLRLQEYIELVKHGKLPEAIAYAKKHFPPWVETHLKEIQQAMALLAFPLKGPNSRVYSDHYNNTRWAQLVEQFRADNFALYSLTSQPLLSISLQAGLSALKTPLCYIHENKNLNCPVCNERIGELARLLPFSHHNNSTIVCRITGEIMNENNPPMLLPNGYVYSLKALEEMAVMSNGYVTCPRSGKRFQFTEAKKVFIT